MCGELGSFIDPSENKGFFFVLRVLIVVCMVSFQLHHFSQTLTGWTLVLVQRLGRTMCWVRVRFPVQWQDSFRLDYSLWETTSQSNDPTVFDSVIKKNARAVLQYSLLSQLSAPSPWRSPLLEQFARRVVGLQLILLHITVLWVRANQIAMVFKLGLWIGAAGACVCVLPSANSAVQVGTSCKRGGDDTWER